jgi:teichuronic acid biosynthesis glycosyltransferase TuaG
MGDKALVAVIMPVFNVEKYIVQALNSLLNQTYEEWLCYIVDDCSTDNTLNIIKLTVGEDARFLIKEVGCNSGRPSIARNLAISECKGEYVAFLDGDDYWHVDKLKKQVEMMENNEAALCFTGMVAIDQYSIIKKRYDHKQVIGNYFASLLVKNSIATSSVMIRLSSLNKLAEPCFDSLIKIGEDYDLYLRLASKFDFCSLNEVLVFWRDHELSLTKASAKEIANDLAKVFIKIPDYCHNVSDYQNEMNVFQANINYYFAKNEVERGELATARKLLFPSIFVSYKVMALWVSLLFGAKAWGLIHVIKKKLP